LKELIRRAPDVFVVVLLRRRIVIDTYPVCPQKKERRKEGRKKEE
jgi:hypothetical protein